MLCHVTSCLATSASLPLCPAPGLLPSTCLWDELGATQPWEANSWTELSPSGSLPAKRSSHGMVWSDVVDGFYVFGGFDGTDRRNDLWLYGRQAGSTELAVLKLFGAGQ